MLFPLLLRAQESPGNWVEIIFVLLVLAGGMIKSIARAVKSQKEAGASAPPSAGKAAPSGRLGEAGPPVGLDRWEALLRGELPLPAPPPSRRAAPTAFEESLEGESLEAGSLEEGLEPGPMLAEFPSNRSAPGTSAPSELTHLPSEDRALPDEEAITRRASEESTPATSFALGEIGAPARPSAGTPRRARSPGEWRAAFVNAELLGPPLALRGPGPGLFGPHE